MQQQHDDAELGDESDDRVFGDGVKKLDTEQREIAEYDAQQQFTEHRRKAEPLRQRRKQAGAHQDDGEPEQVFTNDITAR